MRSITQFILKLTVGGVLITLGCGGSGDLGATCSSQSDCDNELQCLGQRCVERCERAPDCGDGYHCEANGQCRAGDLDGGESCDSEPSCRAGLACRLDESDPDNDGQLGSSCAADLDTSPAGAACENDLGCRTGTCALGICIDVCASDRDCARGYSCASIPRISVDNAPVFLGCLPREGSLTYEVPQVAPAGTFDLAIPSTGRSAIVTMSIDSPDQSVGATRVEAPTGDQWYETPLTYEAFYQNAVRHQPRARQSQLGLPGSPDLAFVPGVYKIGVSSFRNLIQIGTAIPRVSVTIKLDNSPNLDLRITFLNLAEHPCRDAFGASTLDKAATTLAPFQGYLDALRRVLAVAGISLRSVTYRDLLDHPELDSLSLAELPLLLSQSGSANGFDLFFARTMSPAGTIALIDGTPGSPVDVGYGGGAVAIAADALCYRSWEQLARVSAHAIARHLGLSRNVEPRGEIDPIADSSTSSDNLMFYSDLGGTELSPGQRDILLRSPVLR